MLDFFAQQAQARRNTRLLVGWMVLAVLVLGAALYLVSLPLLWQLGGDGEMQGFMPEWFVLVLLGTAAFVGLMSGGRALLLRHGGGRQVAEMLGGRLVVQGTTDPLEQRLLNVVEEMALAAGTPMPLVFVLDAEPGINAFAAGYTLRDAVVAVTRGTLESLPREQLQGVIAHEFSHIVHSDMRLNIRLIGIVFGIVCLSVVGRLLMQVTASGGARRSRDSQNFASALVLLGVGMLLIGAIGSWFGRIIQAAVSRQREFLADASAVQFTRNPGGLAAALRSIASHAGGSQLASPRASEVRHMLFGDAVRRRWRNPLATHPPLAERIRRLEASAMQPPQAMGLAPSALPADLHAAAGHPHAACALVYALACHADPAVRAKQLQAIASGAFRGQAEHTQRLLPAADALSRAQRLQLASLCAPALRQLSVDQRQGLRRTLQALIEADERIELFEYVFLQTVMPETAVAAAPLGSLRQAGDACQLLFSAMAWAGTSDAAAARSAYAAACGRVAKDFDAQRHPLLPAHPRLLGGLGDALQRLAAAPAPLRAKLVDACVRSSTVDGELQSDEAELLRCICQQLDCPLPRDLVVQPRLSRQ